MLAILFAIRKWEHDVRNQHFSILIDHQSLKYLLEQKITTPSQQAWVAKLMQFDYEIKYRKGRENVAADALSWSSSGELHSLTVVVLLDDLLTQIEVGWQEDSSLKSIIDAKIKEV